jgi:hypothetical protein
MGYLNQRIVRSRPGLSHSSSFSHRIGVGFQTSTQHKTLVAAMLAGGVRKIATAGKPCRYRFSDVPRYRLVPFDRTLRVVTQCATLRVNLDAERPATHFHAERGNVQLKSDAIPVGEAGAVRRQRCGGSVDEWVT